MDTEAVAGMRLVSLDGFPSLATFIASDPDHTSLVFKRFDKLAARNLLYLQSELAELQAKQDHFDVQDLSLENGSRRNRECAMNWESFSAASQEPDNEKQKERMKLVIDIRAKLKEYRISPLLSCTTYPAHVKCRRSVDVRKFTRNAETTSSSHFFRN
jgi:hypothetical protein